MKKQIIFFSLLIFIAACDKEQDDNLSKPLFGARIDASVISSFEHEIFAADFLPNGVGYALGAEFSIYKYTPSEGWHLVRETPFSTIDYKKIYLIDENNIIISKIDAIGGFNEAILKSSDGGLTWSGGYGVSDEDQNSFFTPSGFHFVNSQVGFAFSAPLDIAQSEYSWDHFMLRTTDGGNTWSKIMISEIYNTVTSRYGIWDIDSTDPNNIIATGYETMLRSTDMGQTWTPITKTDANGLPFVADFRSLEFRADNSLMAGGPLGNFWNAPSPYISWKTWADDSIPVRESPYLDNYLTPNIDKIKRWNNTVLLLASNTYWISFDGGYTWTRPERFPPGEIKMVYGTNRTLCFTSNEGEGYFFITVGFGNTATSNMYQFKIVRL